MLQAVFDFGYLQSMDNPLDTAGDNSQVWWPITKETLSKSIIGLQTVGILNFTCSLEASLFAYSRLLIGSIRTSPWGSERLSIPGMGGYTCWQP